MFVHHTGAAILDRPPPVDAMSMPDRGRYSWICPDAASRARFLTMHERMFPVAQRTGVLLAILIIPGLVGAPHPWLALGTIAVGLAQYGVTQIKVPRLARPEVWVAVSFSIMQLLVMFGVVFAGRVDDGGMVLLVWACVGVASRLPTRAVVPLTAWSIVLYLAAWLLTDPQRLISDPALATVGIGILITCSAIVTTLRNSDSANHAASIIDQLTGLFNRGAFERRIQELERADAPLAEPIGVVLLDIDHFKGVNDELGHDRGDDVLRSVAETLAAHVREGDELYRLGGEEFIVLLPATAERAAAEAAERLLASVRSARHAGVDVTISAGVAASPAGASFSWRHAYHDADTALYAAKEGGRDQVRTATAVAVVTELGRAA